MVFAGQVWRYRFQALWMLLMLLLLHNQLQQQLTIQEQAGNKTALFLRVWDILSLSIIRQGLFKHGVMITAQVIVMENAIPIYKIRQQSQSDQGQSIQESQTLPQITQHIWETTQPQHRLRCLQWFLQVHFKCNPNEILIVWWIQPETTLLVGEDTTTIITG